MVAKFTEELQNHNQTENTKLHTLSSKEIHDTEMYLSKEFEDTLQGEEEDFAAAFEGLAKMADAYEIDDAGADTPPMKRLRNKCVTRPKGGSFKLKDLVMTPDTFGKTNRGTRLHIDTYRKVLVKDEIITPAVITPPPHAEESHKSFVYFPKLPLELRRKIWKEALPGPRVVEVFLDYDHNQRGRETCWKIRLGHNPGLLDRFEDDDHEDHLPGEPKYWYKTNFVIKTRQPPPTLLSVSRESRIYILEKYTVRLDTIDNICHIHIDPVNDTLLIGPTTDHPNFGVHAICHKGRDQEGLITGEILMSDALTKIQNIALPSTHIPNSMKYNLTRFASLKNVTYILHDICEEDGCCSIWNTACTHRELVKLDPMRYNASRLVSFLLKYQTQDIMDDWKEVFKKQFPDWKIPQVSFKSFLKDGMMCCFETARRASQATS